MIWIWLLLAVLPIVVVVCGLLLCLPYWHSPEKRWRDRVLRTYHAAQRQVQDEHRELQRLSRKHGDEKRSLSQDGFERFLAGISVNELDAYPGIGPVTIDRLKQASYGNLARLRGAQIHIQGLGPKRLSDVTAAVQQLIRQAESRFQAGACPESQQLAAQLRQLDVRYAELSCRANARAKRAAEVIRQLEPLLATARQITFWKYFWKDAQVVVPPELLQCPVPDLRTVLTAAEGQAGPALPGHEATETARAVATASPLRNVVSSTRPVANVVPATAPAPVSECTQAESSVPIRAADRRQTSALSAAAPTKNRTPEPQTRTDSTEELVEATIQFAFAIARTDGSISRKEKAFITAEMERRYGYDKALYNRAKAWCAQYEMGAIDLEKCLTRIHGHFAPEGRKKLLELAYQIAQASGPMNQREIHLLERAAREWGVPWQAPPVAPEAPAQAMEPMSAQPVVQPSSSPGQAQALLEIATSAPLTADLIRRQYNLLSSRLAPEKLQALGPEFVAMAESKRQALRAAAETLLRPLGEPLDLPARAAEPAELRPNPDLDAMFGV